MTEPTPGVARLAGPGWSAHRRSAPATVQPGAAEGPDGRRAHRRPALYRDPFEFDPVFTLWLAANERPPSPLTTTRPGGACGCSRSRTSSRLANATRPSSAR